MRTTHQAVAPPAQVKKPCRLLLTRLKLGDYFLSPTPTEAANSKMPNAARGCRRTTVSITIRIPITELCRCNVSRHTRTWDDQCMDYMRTDVRVTRTPAGRQGLQPVPLACQAWTASAARPSSPSCESVRAGAAPSAGASPAAASGAAAAAGRSTRARSRASRGS